MNNFNIRNLKIIFLAFVVCIAGSCKVKKAKAAAAKAPAAASAEPAKVEPKKPESKPKKEISTPLNIKFKKEGQILECITSGISDAGYSIVVSYKSEKLTADIRTIAMMASSERQVYKDGVVLSKNTEDSTCTIALTGVKKEAELKIALEPNQSNYLVSIKDKDFESLKKMMGKNQLDLECKADNQLMEACQ